MMVIKPRAFFALLCQEYEIVHIVMPLNLSGIWLLAGFCLGRLLRRSSVRCVCVRVWIGPSQ